MAFPDILIGSKFDGKGFKQAETAVGRLNKSVKNLGKTFGYTLGTAAAVGFGKAMVKAFMEDQKAAAQLSNTVKNLGLAFADADIQSFVEKLSLASGVADDELRPAMQKLLQVTGSVTKSQDLLKNAIDISKGSGTDLATVASDLANAYVGNNKGLKKYALGLSAAELKTASFDKVLKAFNRNFAGAGAADLKTVAGQFGLITNAAKEAEETIGSGLVDAFKTLTSGANFGDLSTKISDLATNIADFFRGLAIGFRDLANMPVIKQLLQLAGIMLKIIGKVAGAVIDPFVKAGQQQRNQNANPYGTGASTFLSDHAVASNKAAAAKAEAAAKKRAKELLAAQTANTNQLKKQNALKKDSAVFDQQQIELVAALKGKLSEEDRKRAELQLALLNENETAANDLTKQVLMAQDSTGKLYQYFLTIGDAKIKNPFEFLDQWIKDFQDKLNNIKLPNFQSGTASNGTPNLFIAPSTSGSTGNTTTTSNFPQTVLGGIVLPATNASNALPSDSMVSYSKTSGLNYNPNANVNLTITGDSALTKAIADSLQVQSLSGIPSSISRLTGVFG